jgi:hypothetical protein
MVRAARDCTIEVAMKSILSRITLLLLATAALFSAGCRANSKTELRHNIDLLEQESRLLEDKNYELKDTIREYQDALDICRMKNGTPREDTSGPSIERTDASDARDPGPSFGQDNDRPGGFSPPVVELPDEESKEQPEPGGLQIPDVPDHIQGPSRNELPPAPDADKSTRNKATHLIINADRCGGYDDDNRPGDEGISVSLEPRDSRGRAVSTVGDVIIVLRDPQLSGDAAYVARWEFTASQLAEVFNNSDGGGMHLTLSWPDRQPRHETLDLFVRYITPDGHKLDASGSIGVKLASSSPASSRSTSDGWIVSRNPVPAEPERAEIVQAVYEEPLPEESAEIITSDSRPTWSPRRL